ncbi:MAG: SpaA isopeptide-forming pilin-related protein [Chryseosolibacter sp.]
MNPTSRILAVISVAILLSGFQLIKTTLHITVRDDLGNIVEGATVQLFETEDDYLKEQNVAAEITTDKYGIAKFKNLKPVAYYVIARTEDKDNAGGGERTAELEAKRINKVTIVIQ